MFSERLRSAVSPKKRLALLIIYCAAVGSSLAEIVTPEPFVIKAVMDIGTVPSDFPVGFCLLTSGKSQYVAYYDAERRMTIAKRNLDSNQWQYQPLPSKVGWDSHNYITMAVDKDGQLHVSGNMHCVKLIYF